MNKKVLGLILFSLLILPSIQLNAVKPVNPAKVYYNAFSHNDIQRAKPLTEALSLGYNCVEVDLWMIDGELYVSHDKPEIRTEITFENLYLCPLIERIYYNGGKVYANSDKPFYLMIDCKTNGEEMLPVLKKKLDDYKPLLCSVENGKLKKGAMLVFLSGDRPLSVLDKGEGYIFLDGQIKNLGQHISSLMMPVISDDYSNFLTWKGDGPIPTDQLQKMRDIIKRTHDEGKLFRWWGAPDTPQFKRFFIKENVDLIGADNLKALYDILNE